MPVVRPPRRAWNARGTRLGTAASALALLAACADPGATIAPAAAAARADHLALTPALAGGVTPSADLVNRVRLTVTAGRPTPGYIFTSVPLDRVIHAVVFDTAGRVVWARGFAESGGAGGNAYVQANGNVTLFLGASRGWEPVPGVFAEVRPSSGVAVRQWSAPAGYYNDLHELLVGTGARPTYLFGYNYARMDLRHRGGSADSLVAQHTIFSVDAGGTARAVFDVRDHFVPEDWKNPETLIQDFAHPNSIDLDTDGGLIVSWRNMDEVSKIDPATGQFVWRLGGRHSSFRFVNDPLNGFSGQHFARVLPNGNLLLFDNGNGHSPKESRAVEYRLDRAAGTATMVWEFRRRPLTYTPFVGSVQRLPNGNTVVGFGNAGIVTEVAPDGRVVWEGELTVDGRRGVLAYRLLKQATIGRLRP